MQFRNEESEEKYYKTQCKLLTNKIANLVVAEVEGGIWEMIGRFDRNKIKMSIQRCLNDACLKIKDSWEESYNVLLVTRVNLEKYIQTRQKITAQNALILAYTSFMISHKLYIDISLCQIDYLGLLNEHLTKSILLETLSQLEINFLDIIGFKPCNIVFHADNSKTDDKEQHQKRDVLLSIKNELEVFKKTFIHLSQTDERKFLDLAIQLTEQCINQTKPIADLITELNKISAFSHKNLYREKLIEKLKLIYIQEIEPSAKPLLQFYFEMDRYESILEDYTQLLTRSEEEKPTDYDVIAALKESKQAVASFVLEEKHDEELLKKSLKKYQGFFKNSPDCDILQNKVLKKIESETKSSLKTR